jgi:hypothetical protein
LIKTARYDGNKWGGKYLRAPDVFFATVRASGKNLVRIGSVRWFVFGRGRRTGADSFFYLDHGTIRRFAIEKRFLRPLVKSPTDFDSIGPATSLLSAQKFVFLCPEAKSALRGSGAFRYISDGESRGVQRANLACVGGYWWNLGIQATPDIILPIAFNDRFFVVLNDARFEVHQRFATVRLLEEQRALCIPLAAYLNSTVVALMAEVLGRRGLGQGALDFPPEDWKHVLVPKPEVFDHTTTKQLTSLWEKLKSLPPRGIETEIRQADRRALDEVVFDVLGLTVGEREAVYEAVVGLVRSRLEKARSV